MSKMATFAYTSILTKMYILYKKELIYNYQKLGLYPYFYKIHNKAIYDHFFVSNLGCVPSPGKPSVPEIMFPRQGEQCPVV